MAKTQTGYSQPQQSMITDSISPEINSNSIRDIRSKTRQELLQSNNLLKEEQPTSYEQTFQLASKQEQIIYDQKGLDYASNLPFINKRDLAGNLIINGTIQDVPEQEAAAYNESVILEANTILYTNRSVIRAIDTQFKYFKFPPVVISRQTPIDEIQVEIPGNDQDLFSARYTPDFIQQWFTFAPSYEVSGIPWGYQKLEFNNVLRGPQQIEAGTYTITPELIESGKNLRMRYKVDVHNERQDSEVGFLARLQRKSADYQDPLVDIARSYKLVPAGGYDSLQGEFIVQNRTMRAWDKWFIQGKSGTRDRGRYFADQSYWIIEAIDA